MSSWFTSLLGGSPEDRGPTDFYECTYCRSRYDEWQDGCPECGQLVVRIVETPGRPGR